MKNNGDMSDFERRRMAANIAETTKRNRDGAGVIAGTHDANGNPLSADAASAARKAREPEPVFDKSTVEPGQLYKEIDDEGATVRLITTVSKLDATDVAPELWLCSQDSGDGPEETKIAPSVFGDDGIFLVPPKPVSKALEFKQVNQIGDIVDQLAKNGDPEDFVDLLTAVAGLKGVLGKARLGKLDAVSRLGLASSSSRMMGDSLAASLHLTAQGQYVDACKHLAGAIHTVQTLAVGMERAFNAIRELGIMGLSEEERLILAVLDPVGDPDEFIPLDQVIGDAARIVKGPTGHPEILVGYLQNLAGLNLIDVEPGEANERPSFRRNNVGSRVLGK